ncbi:MAG TPA: serine/threonine-protein kinase, partial [Abditibacterium sp.]
MNDPRSPLESGMTLRGGDFSVESALGMGGFGITYRAKDHRLKRVVAVKEFFPQGCVRLGGRLEPSSGWTESGLSAQRDRFLEEGRTLARLRHPGIPIIFDIFEENRTAYLVMEFVEGQTFAQYLADKKLWFLPPDEAVSLICGAGGALALMHGAQLLHRDLKPANIMRRFDGQVMLIDFGASRDFLPEAMHTLTVIFTAGYAPLEQYTRSGTHGPYTDVYSLSATLYHLLTGQKPLEAPRRATGEVLASPHEVNPIITPALSAAVMHGLEIAPNQRPATVEAFLNELTQSQTVGFNNSHSATISVATQAASDFSSSAAQNAPPTPRQKTRRGRSAQAAMPQAAPIQVVPIQAVPPFAVSPGPLQSSPRKSGPGRIRRAWNSLISALSGSIKVLGWTALGGGLGFALGATIASQLPFGYSSGRSNATNFLEINLALLLAMWLGRRSYLREKRLHSERTGKIRVLDPSKFTHVVLSTVWGAVASSLWIAVLGCEFLGVMSHGRI